MNRNIARYFRLVVLCICLGFSHAQAEGLRSIGVCLALSWTDTPFMVGIEASTDLASTVLSGALFITPDGKTLFTGHVDIPVQEDAATFLRVTAGFSYFEPTQPFPYPLVGLGLTYLLFAESPVYVGFSGEFIYPLTLPHPMFSISGGWLP